MECFTKCRFTKWKIEFIATFTKQSNFTFLSASDDVKLRHLTLIEHLGVTSYVIEEARESL